MEFGNKTGAKLIQFYVLFDDMAKSQTNCLEIKSPLSKKHQPQRWSDLHLF
jgi:hypothetical protein